jgi:oxygen-independent coproporphyrinogen-3 oxidase
MTTASLYIHVPYCVRKCDYCDFFSIPVGGSAQESSGESFTLFTETLIKEIASRKSMYGIDRWRTIYIGGGTPSLLSPGDVRRLGKAVAPDTEPVDDLFEWTIEANPEDITQEWLAACRDAGINRLSIGLQSMQDNSLEAVGRRGSRKGNLCALELVSREWRGRLSLDLIAGLPEQSKEALLADIVEIIAFKPDHISLYSLTVEEGTPLNDRLSRSGEGLRLPEGDDASDIWISGRNLLDIRGYAQYEVSNFAKPGYESRHNQTYWNLDTYVGVGPGATGTIVAGDTACRYTDTTDIASWLADPAAGASEETIGRADFIRETIMMGFRLVSGISRPEFHARFGFDILDCIGSTVERWESRRLLVVETERIRLTKEGLLVLNRFLVDCLEEIEDFSE